ncbi:hypothetical protein K8S19_00450 [bacterium]|nr:hypothetical protein [bacterium]
MLEKGIPRDFFRTKGRPLSHLYRASANTMDSLPGECRVSPSMKRVKISPKANISRQKYHGRKPVDFYFIHTKRYIKVKQKLFAKQHSREISPAFRFSFE